MDIQQTILPTGLRVVTARLPGFDMASTAVFIRAGARDEDPTTDDYGGVAHFLEHMAFKGTTSRSALKIASEIEDLGSYINAYTSYDTTAYYVNGLSQDVPQAVAILGDVLTNSIFDPKEIETEKGVILQEISRSFDNPNHVAYNNLSAISYRAQGLGRSILGDADFIRRVEAADFRAFTKKNYNTSTMIILGTGAVEHQSFVRQVEQHFSAIPQGVIPHRDPAVRTGGLIIDSDRPFEQVTMLMDLPTVRAADPRAHHYRLLSGVLGGGMSSPLFQEVREKRGLVYSVGCSADFSEEDGSMTFYAGTTAEHASEVLDVTCDEIRKTADGIKASDLLRAKAALKVGIARLKQDAFDVAEFLANGWFLRGSLAGPDERRALVEAVTVEDVQAAAQALCQTAPAISMVGPAPHHHYTLHATTRLRA